MFERSPLGVKHNLMPDESTLAESLRKRMALAGRRVLTEYDEDEKRGPQFGLRRGIANEEEAAPSSTLTATAAITHSRAAHSRQLGDFVLREVPDEAVTSAAPTDHSPVHGIELARYRSPIALAQLLVIMLAVQSGCFVAALIAPGYISTGRAAPIEAMLFSITGLALIVWTYRLYRNLQVIGAAGLSTTPLVAAALVAIPVANLIAPPIIFHEIWRATDPNIDNRRDHSWRQGTIDPIVPLWWITFIAASFINLVASMHTPWSGLPYLPIATDIAFSLSGVLGIASIWRLSVRQDDKQHMLRAGVEEG